MPWYRLPRLHHPRAWQALLGLATLAVIVLSLIPSPPQPPGPLAWDKAQHLLAYAVLTAGWGQATAGRCWTRVVVALLLMGVAIEGLQGLGGVRYPQLTDVIANTLGVAAGFAIALSPAGRLMAWLDTGLARLTPSR